MIPERSEPAREGREVFCLEGLLSVKAQWCERAGFDRTLPKFLKADTGEEVRAKP